MVFRVTRAHFLPANDPPADITAEMSKVTTSGSGRTVIPLTNEGFMYLSQHYLPVTKVADLDTLPDKLPKDKEMSFSPLFDPKLVDGCCTRGFFPLTLAIGRNMFIFAPKLHTERSVCALVDTPAEKEAIKRFPYSDDMTGAFQGNNINISKKLLRPRNTATRQASFDVFTNRREDWAEALQMMRDQHSENWFCEALRECFYWMLVNPEKSSTKVLLTVIRRHQYDKNAPVAEGCLNEGDMVAAELGFIVGDIYASATGAYCVDGAGLLQLAVTAEIAKCLGCKVWDLGMCMDYKKNILGCVEVRRKQWVQMVREHKDNNVMQLSAANDLLAVLQLGCPVGQFVGSGNGKSKNEERPTANPDSKSQRKKRQKIENYHKRKIERREKKAGE